MTSKPIVLITGANGGLGMAILKSLCQSSTPYEILIGCRDTSKGEEAKSTTLAEVPDTSSTLSAVQVDIASDDSIHKAAEHVASTFGRLDVLVNNAGANMDFQARQEGTSTRDLWNRSWDVNVAGTGVMTETFVPLLLKSTDPRLIFMTSGTASLAETYRTEGAIYERLNAVPEAGWPKESVRGPSAYRSVKTGLNMMMRDWTRILSKDGVKVWCVSPGFLATGLGGMGAERLKAMGAKDPSEGGDFTRAVIEGKRDGDAGKSIRADEIQQW